MTEHIGSLKPDPKNARRHTPRNVGMIEDNIRRYGFGRPIVIDKNRQIIAGNATVEAAAAAGIEEVVIVPSNGRVVIAVQREDVDSDSEEFYGLSVGDNRSAELADGWIGPVLASLDQEYPGLRDQFFYDDEWEAALAAAIDEPVAADDGAYSRSVESPVYAITGERPAIKDLVDTTKADALLAHIDAADLDDDLKRFLRFAAYRHLHFDYAKVAEFYAHADATVQDLMERSALVIIDVDQAIEYGFVRLVGELRELRAEDDDAA